MLSWLTPEVFHEVALTFKSYRWRLLGLSGAIFLLFTLLTPFINSSTPLFLLILLFFILFSALQSLVCAAFIFFFLQLPSQKNNIPSWKAFYRSIEVSETYLFAVLLPSPILIFLYGAVKLMLS